MNGRDVHAFLRCAYRDIESGRLHFTAAEGSTHRRRACDPTRSRLRLNDGDTVGGNRLRFFQAGMQQEKFPIVMPINANSPAK